MKKPTDDSHYDAECIKILEGMDKPKPRPTQLIGGSEEETKQVNKKVSGIKPDEKNIT